MAAHLPAAMEGSAKFSGDAGRAPGCRGHESAPTPARGRAAGARQGERPAGPLEESLRRKGVDDAWKTLDEMLRQGLPVDRRTVSRMLARTLGDGHKTDAPRAYLAIARVEAFMDQRPEEVDEVLMNAVLDACCRLKDVGRLKATFDRMRALGVAPSSVTLGILVKAYGQARDLRKVISTWEQMGSQQMECNQVTHGCMIDACVRCGDVERAAEIFGGLREQGKHRNTILYSQLIKGFGQQRDLTKAFELFREMPQEGVPYNRITFNSMIDACVRCSNVEAAESLLGRMMAEDPAQQPDLVTFSILLKGHCQRGNMDKALGVAEMVSARGLQKDELVYNTLIDGCVKARDIGLGVGLFREMIQQGLRPSAITHNILLKLYRSQGCRGDEAGPEIAKLCRAR